MSIQYAPNERSAGLRFEILGEVRVWRHGAQLPLGACRQRALLAALLLHAGSPVSKDRLIDGIWGDADIADGANLLQAYVSKLRRLLDPEHRPRASGGILSRVGASYLLDVAADSTDLGRFERHRAQARALRMSGATDEAEHLLTEALAGWQHQPLTGLDGPLFEVERVRLTELRLAAVEERGELALELGAHASLVPELLSLTSEHPYREHLWALLMVALYRCNRQADALAVFRRARTALMDNLGLVPGPELRELEQAVLAGVPDPFGRPAARPSPPQHPQHPRLSLVPEPRAATRYRTAPRQTAPATRRTVTLTAGLAPWPAARAGTGSVRPTAP
ncbi:BTAD domain-containing putative transcriptional regulator [Peterkaempfera sp. SMS 1(5)a]|uniref:AfsR/SARP family transcriptional regulator n=1 Tax=Peterkaempfera podocarpi TaxID=3232308 RepID=UPI00366C7798